MGIEIAALSWNPVSDFEQLTTYPFMVQALQAGAIVAVMAGAIGWFMVLRRQTFAGHTLSVIAFPGAAAATLAGLPIAVGYFGACGLGALALSLVGRAGHEPESGGESAAIGTVQAFGLGLGFLFVGLYGGQLVGLESLLFGTFLGITAGQVQTLLWIAVATLLVLALVARPLLFASVDGAVARAAGVPTRLLGLAFLLLLGMAVAATAQITGALLVFALLVTPAATAQQLTARPWLGLLLSVAIALVVTWTGLGIAYFSPYPVGFWVTSLSFGVYVAVRLGTQLRGASHHSRASGSGAVA
ncbi:MAG: zinc/manganese transport system permease protein [Solirubrobacterales bacterium]|jgi:zinc/manganese transport system permease protein|nr:zinc/manganese transport system permease protein [Solirubrobacterales bacterium]